MYTVIANEFWQTYADFKVSEGEDKCNNYWNNGEEGNNKKYKISTDIPGFDWDF